MSREKYNIKYYLYVDKIIIVQLFTYKNYFVQILYKTIIYLVSGDERYSRK